MSQSFKIMRDESWSSSPLIASQCSYAHLLFPLFVHTHKLFTHGTATPVSRLALMKHKGQFVHIACFHCLLCVSPQATPIVPVFGSQVKSFIVECYRLFYVKGRDLYVIWVSLPNKLKRQSGASLTLPSWMLAAIQSNTKVSGLRLMYIHET